MAIITEYPFPQLNFEEQASAPATPGAGAIRAYAKTDGKMYYKDDAGTEYQMGVVGGGVSQTTVNNTVKKYAILGL